MTVYFSQETSSVPSVRILGRASGSVRWGMWPSAGGGQEEMEMEETNRAPRRQTATASNHNQQCFPPVEGIAC